MEVDDGGLKKKCKIKILKKTILFNFFGKVGISGFSYRTM